MEDRGLRMEKGSGGCLCRMTSDLCRSGAAASATGSHPKSAEGIVGGALFAGRADVRWHGARVNARGAQGIGQTLVARAHWAARVAPAWSLPLREITRGSSGIHSAMISASWVANTGASVP